MWDQLYGCLERKHTREKLGHKRCFYGYITDEKVNSCMLVHTYKTAAYIFLKSFICIIFNIYIY